MQRFFILKIYPMHHRQKQVGNSKHCPQNLTKAGFSLLWGVSILLLPQPTLAIDPADSLELVKLYNSTGGPNWFSGWDLNQPADSWSGIVVEFSCGKVESIDLSGIVPDFANTPLLENLRLD